LAIFGQRVRPDIDVRKRRATGRPGGDSARHEEQPDARSTMTHSTPRRYFSRPFASPVGRLRLIASDTGLAAILWENDKPGRVPLANLVPAATSSIMARGSEPDEHPVLVETERQLGEYFAGTRTAFDLPLDPVGT